MTADAATGPDAHDATPRTPRNRRRAAPKPPTDHTGKRSLNLRIDQESYRRLNVHALMTDRTVSDLVMEFARGLRDFSMPHRLNGTGSAGQGGDDVR